MNKKGLSVRKFCIAVSVGAFLTCFSITIVMVTVTGNSAFLFVGLLFTAALLGWGALFMKFFQKKLSDFTSGLCLTLDDMIDGAEKPTTNLEEESQFSRITHRLEQLYTVMQENRRQIEEEKVHLQFLMSDISHQTKTSISNLTMINDTLLSRSMPEEKKREFLQATSNQLSKLDFLIKAMVKISRLETGVITMDMQSSPIYETLVTAINGILAPIEQKQIELQIDCPESLFVSHDTRWTAEALFNLLENAVKYTSAGGHITISVHEWEMYIKIDITDTGKGISEKEQAAIFKRFYREESVHAVEGVGIGLYLSREIITMQGGYIKVASEPTKGSTFSVFLSRQ